MATAMPVLCSYKLRLFRYLQTDPSFLPGLYASQILHLSPISSL